MTYVDSESSQSFAKIALYGFHYDSQSDDLFL